MSLTAKIYIINTKIISLANHKMLNLPINKVLFKEVDKKLVQFLWSGQPAKIKRSTIIAEKENGGLKMPDIMERLKAKKIYFI